MNKHLVVFIRNGFNAFFNPENIYFKANIDLLRGTYWYYMVAIFEVQDGRLRPSWLRGPPSRMELMGMENM